MAYNSLIIYQIIVLISPPTPVVAVAVKGSPKIPNGHTRHPRIIIFSYICSAKPTTDMMAKPRVSSKQMSRGVRRFTLFLSLLFLLATPAAAQQFIGCRTPDGWAEAPMLRKTFTLSDADFQHHDFQTLRFTISIASLGYHEVYVNGQNAMGGLVMQPAVSQLDKRALLMDYDISEYVHKGVNEVVVFLGQGWGRVYGTPAVAKVWVDKTVSDEECGLEYTVVRSDSTWEASPTSRSYTGSWQPMQFGGERYDARVQPDWRPAAVYDAKGIAITRQEFEGNRIVDTVQFSAYEVEPDGSLVIDFGRVVTGWFVAVFSTMEAGSEATIEYLDHRNAKPPHTETDIYVSDGNDRDLFRNRFHMHSFRYVRIKGAGLAGARALQISAVDPTGGATFQCSDPRLNAIHDMVKHTLSCLTFSGYMVDCPHIERMGYGGDGNSSTMTLQTLWDVRGTYRNWLQAWADAMDSTGDLPYVAPAFRTGGGPYWSGFIVKAPWRTYQAYGDRYLIVEYYDKMVRWLDFVEQQCKDGLLQPWPDTERRSWFLGDWLAPEGVDIGGESVLHVSNCFLAECLSDMVQMALLLGCNADAQRFSQWRERLVPAIHSRFYHPETHTYANGTPLDQCYALLTLTEKAEGNRIRNISDDSVSTVIDLVKARLLDDIHGKYRDHLAVGLVGVPVFTEWCIRERQADLMATLLRQPDYPGYLNMIDNGATTTWESWDCGRPGKEDRSRVHNCYNGIGIWFYQALAGIRPDPTQPGYRHFFVDPQPAQGVDWVRATKPTPYGTIRVELSADSLTVTIPGGTTATLFPGTPREQTLTPGTWTVGQ